jgi:transmembrane sensor
MNKNRKGFFQLLDQYQKGTINPIKKQLMDIWYESLDAGEAEKSTASAMPDAAEQGTRDEIWMKIRQGMQGASEEATPVAGRKWWQSVYVKLAAACLLLLVCFETYQRMPARQTLIAQVPDRVVEGMLKKTNDGKENGTVRLPDGSTVALEKGATLYYPQVFAGNDRKVYLKGNGLFKVTPDKAKPFLVYSDHIITRVVGTSFSIRQKEKGTIEVAVLTGIVKVQKNEEESAAAAPANEVVLTPNKKVTFYPETREMITGIVEQPGLIGIPDKALDNKVFDFKDAAFPDIVPLLEKAYGVDIEIAGEDLKNCSITADVSHSASLFEKLEILTEAVGAKFEVIGETIILTGNGCAGSK